jgi:FAD/FMN-containing dehydrogenase
MKAPIENPLVETRYATEQRIGGWGNRSLQSCHVSEAESLGQLRSILKSGDHDSYIARGLGRSYGDPSLNEGQGVILQTGRNLFLGLDESRGMLECQAGVTFSEIIDHLLPRGWFLPTTPGTRFVTVGGAIAADVHGKNHHRHGSLGNAVESLRLLTASGEIVTCSREQNSELFWATIGGMGLTGIILDARFQLRAVQTAYCHVSYRRTAHLEDTLDLFEQSDTDFEYSVAWIDCLARGSKLGRSVVMLANDARVDDLPREIRPAALELPKRRRLVVPFHLPGFVLNPLTIKAFNGLYYSRYGDSQRLVDFNTFFYPLDGIRHWNRIYGRRGFVQYQALFPHSTSRQGLVEMLEKIAHSRRASFLAVLKSSGPANDGHLSYLYPGHTLALDFPYQGEATVRLFQQLDEILLKHGGRLYLAKDSMTSAATFASMYPRLDEFRQVKKQVDPGNLFTSSQARRLGIIDDPLSSGVSTESQV